MLTPHHFHEHAEHRKYFLRHFAVNESAVARALDDRPVTDDPVETLASLGGFEHAGDRGSARRISGGPVTS